MDHDRLQTACPRCQAFYARYPLAAEQGNESHLIHVLDSGYTSDPVRCAFVGQEFVTDGWGCETIAALRAMGHSTRNGYDQTLYVINVPNAWIGRGLSSPGVGFIVLACYKSRRNVPVALMGDEEAGFLPLDLATAEFVLKVSKTPKVDQVERPGLPAYVTVRPLGTDEKVHHTDEVVPGCVFVDYNDRGEVVGVEVLRAMSWTTQGSYSLAPDTPAVNHLAMQSHQFPVTVKVEQDTSTKKEDEKNGR